MVVALVALISSVTGGAVAATVVTSANIKNGTIQLQDISATARASSRGAEGPAGPSGEPGVPGPAGLPGTVGANGANGVDGGFDPARVSYWFSSMTVPAGGIQSLFATCPVGSVVLGGGFYSSITQAAASRPSGNSWFVIIDNDSSIPVSVSAYAVCGSA